MCHTCWTVPHPFSIKVKTVSTIEREQMVADFARRVESTGHRRALKWVIKIKRPNKPCTETRSVVVTEALLVISLVVQTGHSKALFFGGSG